jgi:hypothetical protein
MGTPIQEGPESTVGRKPGRTSHPRPHEPEGGSARSGAAIRREEGDETEFAGEIRERERDEPATERDVD